MAFKKLILIAPFFLMCLTPIRAQDSNYYMEHRYVQRLKWIGDEYAMRYEVIIQKEERGVYTTIKNEFTEASFIQVSLQPGKYRFQVIPYDYLGKPVPASEWMNFEVLPGKAPEAEKTVEYVKETEKVIEYVTEVEYVTEAKTETITVPINQFDILAGLAFVPLLPLYDKNQLFGENISPLGFSARFCAVSAKQGFINPGIEFTASWRVYGLGAEQVIHSPSFELNAIAQKRFPGGKTAINFRAGAGLSLLPESYSSSPNGQYAFHANIGASFLWLFMKNFYLEGGAEFSHSFTKDTFGFIRPWIGIGYRF